MKIKSTLAPLLLLASASVVVGQLRGKQEASSEAVIKEEPFGSGFASRIGKVPASLMENGGHRGLAKDDGMTVVEEADMKPKNKKKPAAPKVEEEEEEEDGVTVGENEEDNVLDWDAEMGLKPKDDKKPKGEDEAPKTKPKVVEQIQAPKKQQPATQDAPKAPPAPAQPQPKKPAPVVEEDDDEDDAPAAVAPKKATGGKNIPNDWFIADPDAGQHPENVKGTGASFTMTVRENEEAVRINSKDKFTGGRFEVALKSGSAMPGIITAIYLASGKGRTGDGDGGLGDQDEIDFEFKGNDPNKVQTNVFLSGKEDLVLVDVGGNTSEVAHNYAIEWDDKKVDFFIDGKNVRTKNLDRALKPMSLHMSVWTTMGGWPGLKAWGGETNWDSRNKTPVNVEFNIISLPNPQA